MAKRKLSGISSIDLRRELDRRQNQLGKLMAQREKIAAELAQLDAELEAFGPVTVRRGPGRPRGSKNKRKTSKTGKTHKTGKRGRKARGTNRGAVTRSENSMTLTESLQKVLKGKTMGVTEVAAAVQKAGYKTNSENFRTIVNQTLIKNPKMFKKVSRGQYTAA
ncbi:MAG: hypothetical protein IT430_11570 [Phycisphaerales bacterium]|nr:hypothetical protein [Phycisphaerales bacterium]